MWFIVLASILSDEPRMVAEAMGANLLSQTKRLLQKVETRRRQVAAAFDFLIPKGLLDAMKYDAYNSVPDDWQPSSSRWTQSGTLASGESYNSTKRNRRSEI